MVRYFVRIADFFRGPVLIGDERDTYRKHLWFNLFGAAATGILANAPAVAIKAMHIPKWGLGLPMMVSSIGMFTTLFFGAWMSTRRKMPFVQVPGMAYAVCSILMALTRNPLYYLTLFGVGAIFEMASRPAITAVLRLNYAPERRGHITGHIRSLFSIVLLVSHIAAAVALRLAGNDNAALVSALMVLAAVLSLASFLVFMRIKVRENFQPRSVAKNTATASGVALRWQRFVRGLARGWQGVCKPAADSYRIVSRDRRFRRYIFGCFVYGFSGMIYSAYVTGALAALGFGYIGLALVLTVVPTALQAATTGYWGRRFDSNTPSYNWFWIRIGWGMGGVLLAVSMVVDSLLPAGLAFLFFVLPVLAKISHGLTMGGSWVLWWRVGIAHYAPPGGDTSRYMGILAFLNGFMRLGGAGLGAIIVAYFADFAIFAIKIFAPDVDTAALRPILSKHSYTVVLLIGGAGVIWSGFYSRRLDRQERKEKNLATIADFEHQFNGEQGILP